MGAIRQHDGFKTHRVGDSTLSGAVERRKRRRNSNIACQSQLACGRFLLGRYRRRSRPWQGHDLSDRAAGRCQDKDQWLEGFHV